MQDSEVKKILDETKEKHLVTRSFRDEEDMRNIGGICFCCDDCCEYFLDPEEKCDKGVYIEDTDFDDCTDCGECVEVCYFDARRMIDDRLATEQEKCYDTPRCHIAAGHSTTNRARHED